MTEDQLEKQALEWFREQGYQYAYGPDIAPEGDTPERRDYYQVILTARLLKSLQRLNPEELL